MTSYYRRFGPALAKRDGWACHWCGIQLYVNGGRMDKATVDHLTPRCRGGTNDLRNLVLACPICNGSRENGVIATRFTERPLRKVAP